MLIGIASQPCKVNTVTNKINYLPFFLSLWQIGGWTQTHNLRIVIPGNTKGGSITVLLAYCLTGLESALRQLTIFVFICKTD
jgi:hypothetical protein